MERRVGRVRAGALAAAMSVCAAAAPSTASAQSTTALGVRVGPSLDGHSDLIASPFPQHGTGGGAALTFVRGSFSVSLEAGTATTSPSSAGAGDEDVWSGDLAARWLPSDGPRLGGSVRLGGGVSAITSVRRHHYVGGSTEFFADLAVPLSVAADLDAVLDPRTGLRESVDVSLATLLFRSPHAGTKDFPPASVSGPWETQVARHRLALSHAVGGRVSLGVSHGLTVVASSRNRQLRLVRQDLSASLSVRLGGGP